MQLLKHNIVVQLGLVLLLGHTVFAQDGGRWVEAKGTGINEEAAMRDANRNALEQGAGSEISSHSQTRDFELIRDAIYARSDGLVSQVTVLGCRPAVGGLISCKIKAYVRGADVKATWGEVQNVLDQIGRPSIMVYIKESIDGVSQKSSVVESLIENRFSKMGFDLYVRTQLEAIEQKEMDDAIISNNISKMRAIAKSFNAQIFITGYANANAAGNKRMVGQQAAMYNADGVLKMYYTDTGQLITSELLTNCRGGARTAYAGSLQGGKKAIMNCADVLTENLYWSAMKKWSTRISSGGTIVLEVEGLSPVEAIHVKSNLDDAAQGKIQSINKTGSMGIYKFRIQTTLSKDSLMILLSEGYFVDLLDITGETPGIIQAVRK